MILNDTSFLEWLNQYTISFFGNGSIKAATIIENPKAEFILATATAANMVSLSAKKHELHQFSNLAYAEPFYVKGFHSPSYKKNY